MDAEEAARYLSQRVPIPASLRVHFGNELPRAEAAARLSSAMGLRSDEQPTLIVGLMLVLLEAVARTLGEGRRVPEDRGAAIADQALAHYTVDECLAIAGYFGGDHLQVPGGTTLGSLRDAVLDLLGQCIGHPLNGALGAWSVPQ